MLKQNKTSSSPRIAQRFLRQLLIGLKLVFLLVALTGLYIYTRADTPTRVEAATSSNLNFQARLYSSTGSLVPDGNYHIEFKLHNTPGTSGGAQGTCSGSCVWRETRTTGNLVTVRNGYFSVNLGSVTAFPTTINWDQDLYLSMNIGGTGGAATWDGEMTPRIKLTAVPYAFKAGGLTQYNGTQSGNLSFSTVANSPDIKLPDITGTNNVLLQSGTTLFTQGSIPFTDSAGRLTQDNTNFFFDDTNNTLGVGTTRTGAINGTGNSRLVVRGSGTTSSTSSLNITNSSNASLFFVRDDGNIGIGTTTPTNKLELAASTATTGGIGFGTDVALYRSAANILSLATGDSLNLVSGNIQQNGTNRLTSTGLFQAADGAVGGPAYSFSGDTNTGIYSGGADILNFATAGVHRWSILANGTLQSNGAQTIQTSTGNLTLATAAGNGHIILSPNGTGNVGIGTTPTVKLDVLGQDVNLFSNTATQSLKIGRNANEHVNISVNDGPGSFDYVQDELDVNHNFSFNIASSTSASADWVFQSQGSEIIRFQKGGNVGIGDASPTYLLTVGNGDLFGVQSDGSLIWEGSTADAHETILSVVNPTVDATFQLPAVGTPGTYEICTAANNCTALGAYINNTTTVQTNANIAIESAADASVTARIRARAGQTADLLQFQNNAGTQPLSGFNSAGSLYFRDATSGFISTISVQSGSLSGSNHSVTLPNAGGEICTTSGNCIGNGGSGDVFKNGQAGPLTIGTNDNQSFYLETNNVQRLEIQGDGDFAFDTNTLFVDAVNDRVGIGTISPEFKLDVVGNTYVQGSLMADYQGVNHLPNGDFESGTTRGFTGLTGVTSADSKNGTYSAYRTGAGNSFSTEYIPVDPDGYLSLEGWFKSAGVGGDSRMYFGTAAYDANKTLINGNGGTYGYCGASNVTIPNTWAKYTCILRGEGASNYNFPAGTRYVRALMLLNYQQDNTFETRIDGLKYVTGRPYETASNGDILLGARATAGNVGIGTTTPTNKLELAASTATTGGIGFGTDVALYRSAADVLALATGDSLNLISGNLQQAGTNRLTSAGLFQAAAGAVGGPAYSFSGDPDTGIYNGGADILNFATAGVHRWSILANGTLQSNGAQTIQTSTGNLTLATAAGNGHIILSPHGIGNVGIGLSGPTANLDITGSASGTSSLRLRSGDIGSFPADSNQILFSYNSTANYTHSIKSRHNGSAQSGNALDFYVWDQATDAVGTVGSKHVLTLDGTGNVGIGDASPAALLTVGSGDLFQVNSSGAVAAATGISSSGTIAFSGLSTNGLVKTTGGTGTLAVATAGTDYQAPLSFSNGLSESGGVVTLGGALTANTTITQDNAESLSFVNAGTANTIFNLSSTGDFDIQDNGTSVFFVRDNGNVGIGTTGPGYKLDVAGTSNIFHVYPTGLSNSSTSAAPYFQADKDEVTLFLGSSDDTSTYLADESSGNVRFNGAGVAWGDFGYYPTGGDNGEYGHFRLSLTGTTIDWVPDAKLGVGSLYSAGNVGIGTVGPDRRLDVLDASNPQLRLTQADGTQFVDFQVDSASNLTIASQGTSKTLSLTGFSTLNCTDCINFDDMADTMTLDANMTLNQGTNTWNQDYTGTGNGITYTGNNLTSGALLNLSVNGTGAASNSQTALNILTTGANATAGQRTFGINAINSHSGATSTNVAIQGSATGGVANHGGLFTASGASGTNIGVYGTAFGGTNNYAAVFDQGNVGIGTTAPTVKLQVAGGGINSTGASSYGVSFLANNSRSTTTPQYGFADTNIHTANAGTSMSSFASAVQVTGGSMAALHGFYFANATGAGTVAEQYGMVIEALSKGTNNAGVVIGEATGTNQANLVIGQTTIPSGSYSIYNSSTDQNYFAGRVGIGTSSPQQKLEVRGSGIGADIARIRVASTDNQAGIELLSDNTGPVVMYSPDGTDNFHIFAGTDNRFTILSGGNVGIGTVSPIALFSVGPNSELQVDASGDITKIKNLTYSWPSSHASGVLTNNGSGTLTWSSAGAGDITAVGSMLSGDVFASSAASGQWLGLGASAGRIEFDDLTIDEINFLDANVGIGTSAPGNKLHVVSSSAQTSGTFTGAKIETTQTAANGTGFHYASETFARYNSAGTMLFLGGVKGSAENSGSGTVSFTCGVCAGAVNSGSGTITAAQGILIQNDGGTGGGSITDSYGLYIDTPLNPGNIVENFAIGIEAGAGNVGIGTVGPDRKLEIVDTAANQLRLSYTEGSIYSDFHMNSSGDLTINVDGQTNQLVLDNGGNVGIGTSTPSTKLHVVSPSNTDIGFFGEFKGTTISGSQTVGITAGGGVVIGLEAIGSFTAASGNSMLSLQGIQAKAINSSTGNVTSACGICAGAVNSSTGTITNAYGVLSKNVNVSTGTITNAYGVYINQPTTDINGITAATNITNKYALVSELGAGNAGIGTTTPTALFSVGANAFQVDSSGRTFVNFGASGAGNLGLSFIGDTDTGFYRSAINELAFQTAGADVMTLEASGEVGIGTTNPTSPLHVSSSALDQLRLQGTTANSYTQMVFEGTGRTYSFGVGNASETTLGIANKFALYDQTLFTGGVRLVVDQAGNVGIGDTAPAYRLEIGGGDVNTTGGGYRDSGSCVAGTCASDANLKTNITSVGSALDAISRLNPVSFDFIDDHYGAGIQYGFIAQELEQIFPELVTTDADGYKQVSYGLQLQMYGLAATKELNDKVNNQQVQIDALQQGSVNVDSLTLNSLQTDTLDVVGQAQVESLRVYTDLITQELEVNGTATINNLTVTNNIQTVSLTVTGDARIEGNLEVVGNLTVQGNLKIEGGIATAIGTATTDYAITGLDSIITADAAIEAFEAKLPSAVGIAGRQYTIKKTDATSNLVKLMTVENQTIDGAEHYDLAAQYKYITVVSDGSNWIVIGNN